MDFRRLEAFSKVYELKSFSKAGESLYLSQPTISAHVSALEKDLGIRLFDRLGRVVLPTVAGDILYRHVQEAFQSLENAKAEIQLLQDKVAGRLVLGASTIPAHYFLPQMLRGFLGQYPDVSVELRVGDTESVTRGVLEGEYIVGVVGDLDESLDLTFAPLFKDELVVIAPPDLAPEEGAKDLATLLERPWVMRELGSGTRNAFERALVEAGRDVRSVKTAVVVDSTQAVLRCVQAGLGLSITSRLAARQALERGELREIPVPELSLRRSFFCVYRERRFFFPSVRYFIDHLVKESRALDAL